MADICFDTCKCGAVVVSSATAVAALKADNERLRAALERLVMAKNEKDRHGDTPVYQALKKGAWEAARAALTAQPAEGEK